MRINNRGITRIVFELKEVVIKIPNFTYSWNHFLKGLIANMTERNTYRWADYREDFFQCGDYFGKYSKFSDLLCPVLWASWGGWILIMRKADVKKHELEAEIQIKHGVPLAYIDWINNGYGGDDKIDNYGYYKNRLVKIDYA